MNGSLRSHPTTLVTVRVEIDGSPVAETTGELPL
jgi:hypothetical protein